MKISIRHELSLSFGAGLPRAIQHLLLTPQSSSVQTVRDWRIEVPGMDDAAGFMDAYGNRAHLASQTKPEVELTIAVAGVIETHDKSGVVGRLLTDPGHALFRRVTPLTRPIGAIATKFRTAPKTGKDRIPLLHALMGRVGEVLEVGEQSQSQDGQSQSQSQSSGAPREAADFAHAFVGAARALDIPARFVTGYLAEGEEEDAAFHAWAEAWDDGLGWIGFDAMLGHCPTDRHVRLAVGLDAVSAAPVRSVPAVGTPQVVLSVETAQ
jgi:hypothetical protein